MIDTVARIKELMGRKSWTCYELSVQTGISTNAIYDWFKIGAVPSLGNIAKICEAMDITLEQFFCGDRSYQLSEEEQKILSDWFALSEFEKTAVMNLIKAFKALKNNA